MADSARPVIGGIDTRKDTHVAAVVDHFGAELATRAFPADSAPKQCSQPCAAQTRSPRPQAKPCGIA